MKLKTLKNSDLMKKALRMSTVIMIGAVMVSPSGKSMAMKRSQPDEEVLTISSEERDKKNSRLSDSESEESDVLIEEALELLGDNSTDEVDFSYYDSVSEYWSDIVEALRVNSSVKKIDLSSCSINDDMVALLAGALKENSTITSVVLSDNKINCADALADVLLTNTVITELDLSFNEISYSGLKKLAKALRHNNSVEKLDLSYNDLCFKAASALAKMLKSNRSICEINLDGNYIGSDGMTYLIDSLKTNNVVRSLDLRNNEIGDASAFVLSDLLEKSMFLHIDLQSNFITKLGEKKIKELLMLNDTLNILV